MSFVRPQLAENFILPTPREGSECGHEQIKRDSLRPRLRRWHGLACDGGRRAIFRSGIQWHWNRPFVGKMPPPRWSEARARLCVLPAKGRAALFLRGLKDSVQVVHAGIENAKFTGAADRCPIPVPEFRGLARLNLAEQFAHGVRVVLGFHRGVPFV